MAGKSYRNLKDALKVKLDALTGQDGNALFAGVYLVGETEPAGYPYAQITEVLGQGTIIDTHRNQREWQFLIDIIVRVKNKTPENAEATLLDSIDRVITDFDQDPLFKDANGQPQCQWVTVVPIEFDYEINETSEVRGQLQIAIVDTVNRYP